METEERKEYNVEPNTSTGGFAAMGRFPTPPGTYKVNVSPFAGQLGGLGTNQLMPTAGSQDSITKAIPDASPLMTLDQIFDMKAFSTPLLWKAAVVEGMGTLMLVWITAYGAIGPAGLPPPPATPNSVFAGPALSGLTTFLYLTLFVFCFGATSGAHLNPMITIATFLARLCSFPRAVLYVGAQVGGAAIGGLLLRESYGSRDFQVGGCWRDTGLIATREAFAIEFMSATTILFMAFGVGLDPRQRQTIGPTLGPFLVALSLGVISFGTGYSRYGYGGSSMNPARCFGVFVGSRFPGWHWIHWVGPFAASSLHGVFYYIIPPWISCPV